MRDNGGECVLCTLCGCDRCERQEAGGALQADALLWAYYYLHVAIHHFVFIFE